jgi:CheY-like chemotaxis protein
MPHRLKVLVAEDSENDAFLFHRAVEQTGVALNPRFVNDGQEAVDYLTGTDKFANRDEHPLPALIILDIKMPRMTGLDVLRWLRTQTGLRETPVLILSNSDQDRDVHEAYSLGANAYMVKPSQSQRLDELVKAIDTYWRDFCKLPKPEN